MLIPGLVSITFRPLSPEEVIGLVVKAGLKSIEWGGDVHVPAGNTDRAREVGRRTTDAGLSVAAYGSYYRLGLETPFEPVLESARALGAPTIRVWAGNKGSAECSPQERKAVIDDALRVAEMARLAGITLSLEYHDGTLADAQASVRSLLTELPHPNIEFLWQPSHGETVESCVSRLRDVLPRLRNVHVFHWWPTHRERHPLAEGEERWLRYVQVIREAAKSPHCLLEFVAGDSPEQFLADSATLRRWLA